MKHDAQIDTQICWNPFKNNPKSKRTDTHLLLKNGGSLGAGSVLGRQVGAKWTNMEPKGYQKKAKGNQNGAQSGQNGATVYAKKQSKKQIVFRKGRFKEGTPSSKHSVQDDRCWCKINANAQ